MKISNSKELISREPYRNDCYCVESPRRIITVVDSEEHILDLFPRVALRYEIDQAEELIRFFKATWPDYEEDIYYNQGVPIYPIFQPAYKISDNISPVNFTPSITAYRYKQAGEWVYGITNKWTDEEIDKERAIEAPMDGWDQWLRDRKQILQDKWFSANYGNFDN